MNPLPWIQPLPSRIPMLRIMYARLIYSLLILKKPRLRHESTVFARVAFKHTTNKASRWLPYPGRKSATKLNFLNVEEKPLSIATKA